MSTTHPPTPGTQAPYRRLFRRRDGRAIAGVAAGLARHLRVEVVAVRVAFVLLCLAGGLGALLYAAFWAVVPPDPDEPQDAAGRTDRVQLVAFGALGVGVLVLVQLFGVGGGLVWPAAVAAAGFALIWRQADDARRARWRAASARLPRVAFEPSRAGVLRIVGGVVLVGAGVAAFLAAQGALPAARRALLPIGVTVLGLLLITGPWWLRMARELTEERRARIREQERVEIASHLHDSVLQTLTLIQRHAADPAAVARLARGSERELRRWLYRPAEPADRSLRAALEAVAAEVEDDHGVAVEVVTVGDLPLDERAGSLVAAAREAVVNAAKASGAPTVAVYAEVSDGAVDVFVRDRGSGFDLAAVPADRYGVRESIVGRMQRAGGSAEIRTAPGEGTEVRLRLPVVERVA